MSESIKNPLTVSRRGFLVTTSTLGAGLALGMTTRPTAASASPYDEVNAWVHIASDETVTIRIARSEMGQGTLPVWLSWSPKSWIVIGTRSPMNSHPGQNVARERVWGDFSTGGSRGLRGSHQYVREGGAAAKLMLVQAAADA